MTYRIYFTDDAQNDFNSIIDFIARDNPKRAFSFVDELERRTVELLSQFPNSGRKAKTACYEHRREHRIDKAEALAGKGPSGNSSSIRANMASSPARSLSKAASSVAEYKRQTAFSTCEPNSTQPRWWARSILAALLARLL